MAEETMTPKEMYAEAWLYYLSGTMSLKDIADHLNIQKVTLYTYAGRNKWAARARDIQKKAGRGLKASLAERIEVERLKHVEFALDQLAETGEAIAMMQIGQEDPFKRENKEGKKPLVSVNDKLDLVETQDRIARRVLKLDDTEKEDENAVGFRQLVALQVNMHLTNSGATTGIISPNNAIPDGLKEEDFLPLELIDGAPAQITKDGPPKKEEKVKLTFA